MAKPNKTTQRPQDKSGHPRDGNQLSSGGQQKAGERPVVSDEENQGDGMPAVGGQR
jgi:hypothetical protein